jgi:hypothetical protein
VQRDKSKQNDIDLLVLSMQINRSKSASFIEKTWTDVRLRLMN